MDTDPFDDFMKRQTMQTFKVGAAMEMAADLPLIMPPVYNVDGWYHSTITPRTYVEKTLEVRKNAKDS